MNEDLLFDIEPTTPEPTTPEPVLLYSEELSYEPIVLEALAVFDLSPTWYIGNNAPEVKSCVEDVLTSFPMGDVTGVTYDFYTHFLNACVSGIPLSSVLSIKQTY